MSGSGGVKRHAHLNSTDEEPNLKLANQKFSLVYYLVIGDQESDEPGILNLFNPDESIMPSEGMIIIFPAGRDHSVTYNGSKDRVIIGINFYCL